MSETRWERWSAASGLAATVAGVAGGALERGWPSASDPVAVGHFIAENRGPILAQSFMFLLSAGLYLWFAGALRSYLLRAEGGSGRLSEVTFGSAIAWSSLQMMAQAFQVGVTMTPNVEPQPAMLWTMGAIFGVANLPLAIMLLATAVLSFQHRAFPAWLGWLSVLAAIAQVLLWFGTFVSSGPLAPTGWLAYVLYPLFVVWLVPATIVMIKRSGTPGPNAASKEEARRKDERAGRQDLLPQH